MPTRHDWDAGTQLNLKEARRMTTGIHVGRASSQLFCNFFWMEAVTRPGPALLLLPAMAETWSCARDG